MYVLIKRKNIYFKMCKFVKSEKGRNLLIFKGYLYKLESTTSEKLFGVVLKIITRKPGLYT